MTWALAVCALCAYVACEEDETRPGAAVDCGDDCVGSDGNPENPGIPVNPGIDSPGTGGSGGAGGGANAGAAGSAGVLTGSIQAVVAPDLTTSADLDGAILKVRAPGESVDQVTVDAAPNGTFRLEGVHQNPSLWVGAGLFTNNPASTFVDTLQVVDSTQSVALELLAMRRSVLDEIAQTAFLSNPLELNPLAGHLIVRFVTEDRQGIPGASLIFPDPEMTSVAFDLGDTYSDQVRETSTRGTMVLLNLASNPYPGAATTVAAEVRGTRRDVDVHTASGAVTLVTQVVP